MKEVIKLLAASIALARVSADNEKYLIELSIKEGETILSLLREQSTGSYDVADLYEQPSEEKPCHDCWYKDSGCYPDTCIKPDDAGELVKELNEAIDKVVIAFATGSYEIVTEYSRQLIAKSREATARIEQLIQQIAEQAKEKKE